MDALLILAGLLLLIASVFWLIGRAFSTSLFWGCGTLLPPGWLIFAIRYWNRARSCLLLAGVGAMLLIVGFSMLAQRDPQKLQQLLSLEWTTEPQAAPGALQLQLQGELSGLSFQPEMAELIDGVLTLSEGDDLSRRQLRIHLDRQPEQSLRLDLLPEDRGRLPVIELSWVTPDNPLPQAVRVTHGYTLYLELAPGRPNRMQGNLHLILPGDLATSISGALEVYTSRLRYLSDDQIDPRFNSRETVEWLVLRHLRNVARTQDVEFIRLPPLDITRRRLDLDLDVRVAGKVQNAALTLVHDDAAGWRITEDRDPLDPVEREAVVAEAPPPAAPQVASVEQASFDRRENFSLQRLMANPDLYSQLRMRVRTERGGIAEGRFIGIDRNGQIQIRYMIGSGEASFSIRPSDVTRIELLEP